MNIREFNQRVFGAHRQTPLTLQGETSECGLACLAMIRGYYGADSSLTALRAEHRVSIRGSTLEGLIEIAADLGLQGRAVRLEVQDLQHLRLPCLLHWDMQHYVVLTHVSSRNVNINDPAAGNLKLSLVELSRHFTGVALELVPTADFKRPEKQPSVPIRQLTGRISGLWMSLGQLFALSLGLQVLGLLAPLFLQLTIDHVLVSGDLDLLSILALAFGLLALLQVALAYGRSLATLYLSTSVSAQLNTNVLSHALRLPVEWYTKRHLGDVVSRIGSVASIQKTITNSFVEAALDGVLAATTLIMLLLYSPTLAAVSLGALAAYLIGRMATFRLLRDANEQHLLAAAHQQSHLLESLRGVQSIRAASAESARLAEWQNRQANALSQEVHVQRLGLNYSTFNGLIFAIERVAVVFLGARAVMGGEMSAGMLIAYISYKELFTGRVNVLIERVVEFRMLRLHAERLGEVVLSPVDAMFKAKDSNITPCDFSVSVESVSFRYGEKDPFVLRECSLEVQDGESVAIAGASGCGKSTLSKMLLGLVKADAGVIRLGDREISSLSAREYRSYVGAVLQDDQLFGGSVSSNIAFNAPFIVQADVEAAAKLAGIHQEIISMPMGYRSEVGDLGSSLSGGQKQRILLARALYRKPRVLILDESTSHLDPAKEQEVSASIRSLKMTRIIFAHRIETIRTADRVFVLADGKLSAGGAVHSPSADG